MEALTSQAFVFPFITGIILTAIVLFLSHATGLYKSRGVYPVTLMAIAIFYIVFAAEHQGREGVIFQSLIAAIFFVLAFAGYVKSLWLVVIGLGAHGIFDVIYHGKDSNPAPDWWGPLCLGADLLLALALAGWLLAGIFPEGRPKKIGG